MDIGKWALARCRARKQFWGKLIRGCDAPGGPEEVYLERHFLVKIQKPGKKTETDTLFGVYLHNFMRSDTDRAPHDHPWWFCSLILSGGYFENTPKGRRWKGPGTIALRRATHIHWVELPRDNEGKEKPAITLFIVGPQVREWGFWLKQGWTAWRETFKLWGCEE